MSRFYSCTVSSSRLPLFNRAIRYLGDLNQRIGVATVGGEGAPAGRVYRSPNRHMVSHKRTWHAGLALVN